MNIHIILAALGVLQTVYSEKNCTGVFFNNRLYETEILSEGVNNIRQLAIDRRNNILYFSFDLLRNELTSNIGYIYLNTNEMGTIDGVKNARSVAVDHRNNIVYIGSETGIYKLNNKHTNVAESTDVNDNILKLFHGFDDNLYYTTTRKEAYRFKNGEILAVNELFSIYVDELAIDNTGHIFFIDDYRLFRVQLGAKAINIHEKIIVQSLSTDVNGNLYVCASNGLYAFNPRKYSLVKVAKLNKLKDIAFDANNDPIYAVFDKIVRLKIGDSVCSNNV